MINVTRFILGEIETNTYVLENGGVCAVIDPAVESYELTNFLSGKNVKYVLLTHGHFDHIAGVNDIVNKFGSLVCIHKNDEEMLRDGHKSYYNANLGKKQPDIPSDIIISDGDEIDLNGAKIKVLHTPGHTLGSVCYICEEDKIIFSGDTLFRLSAGRTDLAGISPLEAGKRELASLQKLAALSGDYDVFPGHGERTTLQFERENNRYMRTHNAPYSY